MMDRRAFVAAMAGGLLATSLAAEAQQAGRVYRLGLLGPGGRPPPGTSWGHLYLIEELRELGYVEGQNLVVERRYAEGKTDRLPGLARELVRIPVDVIVAVTATAIDAAKDATRTIPIVMGFGGPGFTAPTYAACKRTRPRSRIRQGGVFVLERRREDSLDLLSRPKTRSDGGIVRPRALGGHDQLETFPAAGTDDEPAGHRSPVRPPQPSHARRPPSRHERPLERSTGPRQHRSGAPR
jgi:ABC transporter substrate binding protein